MKELTGNLWNINPCSWRAITTNGFIAKDGLVMGAGVALQAKRRYPELPKLLADGIAALGNVPIWLPDYKIVTLPVKHRWWENADIHLIEESLETLVFQAESKREVNFENPILIPRPGCGNGGLPWINYVKPVCEKYLLDDRFVIVH